MFRKIVLLIAILCFCSVQSFAIKVDFADASIIDMVQILAREAGLDVVVSGDQSLLSSKRATVHLSDVSPEEAIEYILSTNGLTSERKERTLLISTLSSDISATAFKGDIKVIELKHLGADKAAALLQKVLPQLCSIAGERSNCLILKGKASVLLEAQGLLRQIDREVPQVLIESKVLEIAQSDSLRLGITYGNPPGVFTFLTNKDTGKTRPAQDLQTTINALLCDGKANLVANPRIATLDNHEALINIGSRIPFAVPVTSNGAATQWTVDYIDAGVRLKITPKLGKDGYITSLIQPEVSAISEWINTAAGEFPVITTRNASSTVRVKGGESIVIGGLVSEMERENIAKIPFLGHLPIIGLFFQNRTREKTKSEIIFVITPHII